MRAMDAVVATAPTHGEFCATVVARMTLRASSFPAPDPRPERFPVILTQDSAGRSRQYAPTIPKPTHPRRQHAWHGRLRGRQENSLQVPGSPSRHHAHQIWTVRSESGLGTRLRRGERTSCDRFRPRNRARIEVRDASPPPARDHHCCMRDRPDQSGAFMMGQPRGRKPLGPTSSNTCPAQGRAAAHHATAPSAAGGKLAQRRRPPPLLVRAPGCTPRLRQRRPSRRWLDITQIRVGVAALQ